MNNTAGSYMSSVARRRARRWFIPRMLLLGIVAGVAQWYLPFWSLPASCFLIGFLTAPVNRSAFWAGFIGIFLLWTGLAFYQDWMNDSILSQRVVQLFPLPKSSALLILITGIIGGLLGGMASKTGDLFRRFFIHE